MKRIARRVLKGQNKFDTDNSKTAQDYPPTEGKTSDVITIDGQPATWDPKIRKWVRGVDNHNPDVGYDLDEVTVTGTMPRNGFGQPLYDKNGRPTQYDDSGMKDNLDYVGKNIMYPVMGAIVAAPSFGLISKAFTPSTYINFVPRVAAKFGATSPTIARVVSLFGAGLDMAQAGYFAYDGAKNLYNAWKHPENLQSWTDYGKLGLDALATAGPLGEASKTLHAFGNAFPTLNSVLTFTGRKLYPVLNPVARTLNPYYWLGYESKLKNAAAEGIQESMNIFNKYYKGSAENIFNTPIKLGKPTDYLQDIEFSYLPWDSEGKFLRGINGYSKGLGDHRKMVLSIPRLYNPFSWQLPRALRSTAVHEGNHNFTLDPVLISKYPGFFGYDRYVPDLTRSYKTFNPYYEYSNSSWERAAVNAQIRDRLGLTSKEIDALPTSKFIYKNWRGKPRTIFDKLKKRLNSGYMYDYAKGVRHALEEDVRKNLANGGKGMSEVFPNFADQFANDMKRSLKFEYKYGGRLCKKQNK